MLAHLIPRETPRQQRIDDHGYRRPETVPAFRAYPDFFGNTTSWCIIEEPHDELDVLAESRVSVEPIPNYALVPSAAWEEVRSSFEPPQPPEMFDVVQFTFDTPLTESDRGVVSYARRSFTPGRKLFAAVLDLNARIHADFAFDKKATDTHTTVKEAFELRSGSVPRSRPCRNFVRPVDGTFAARYVSGYLRTQPPPGRERLIGADASHAWFAVWIPPFGWIDFDPTNDMLPSNEHITVAWGREYGDVTPIHGIISGGSEHEVDVAVDVIPEL